MRQTGKQKIKQTKTGSVGKSINKCLTDCPAENVSQGGMRKSTTAPAHVFITVGAMREPHGFCWFSLGVGGTERGWRLKYPAE